MFRMFSDLARTSLFMVSVSAAFIVGGIVFNLDRLGNLDVQLLKYKSLLPKEVKSALPGQNIPYTRPLPKMTMTGRVLEVYDGDTLTLLSGRNKFRVRLFGIDAPEVLQDYGIQSRELLRQLILGQTVSVEILDVDNYGRAIALIRRDMLDINTEMIRSGAAWHYVQYAPGEKGMADAQQEARDAGAGLWQDPGAVPPWEYRQREKRSTLKK